MATCDRCSRSNNPGEELAGSTFQPAGDMLWCPDCLAGRGVDNRTLCPRCLNLIPVGHTLDSWCDENIFMNHCCFCQHTWDERFQGRDAPIYRLLYALREHLSREN
jgi:hypothetical protein